MHPPVARAKRGPFISPLSLANGLHNRAVGCDARFLPAAVDFGCEGNRGCIRGFPTLQSISYTATVSSPNKTPRVVSDTITSKSVPRRSLHSSFDIQSDPLPPSFCHSSLYSIILSTNCVTHMSMFPRSPDGWMNEKVYANPDIPMSSSSPIVRLWSSPSPTVLSVDDDPRK